MVVNYPGPMDRPLSAERAASVEGVQTIADILSVPFGIAFEPDVQPRRPGDPARIVASGDLARRDLDWKMRHDVDDMVASAWQARQAHTR